MLSDVAVETLDRVSIDSPALPPRWFDAKGEPLKLMPAQRAYWRSPHRFNVVPAGRRSGKTELAKRKLVMRAIRAAFPWEPRYFAGAPTNDQARRIFFDDLVALIPDGDKGGRPSISRMIIPLANGARIEVVGLDKPQRIEGSPWDGGVLDEYANMRPEAWRANVRPALADRNGWCDLIGVPEGRNHYYELARMARALMDEEGAASEWGFYTWHTADVFRRLGRMHEVESARRDLDSLTFAQEFEASFVNFEGRAYWPFQESLHCTARLEYAPRAPLIFCFDFNVDPGVAAVCQELRLPGEYQRDELGRPILSRPIVGTAVIGEVWIPRNSNTVAVCRKLIEDWGAHEGIFRCYGDSTGGARGTAQIQGSDWDLIRREFDRAWPGRVDYVVPAANPSERSRVNAVNSRLQSSDGTIRLLVHPLKAPHMVKDFEGVTVLTGGSGELDKKSNRELTHISDAIGYYIAEEFPIVEGAVGRVKLGGY
jgi:hypothetical protein